MKIKIGDPNNAYVEEDGKYIVFEIKDDFTHDDYNQEKYNLSNCTVTNYTDTTDSN